MFAATILAPLAIALPMALLHAPSPYTGAALFLSPFVGWFGTKHGLRRVRWTFDTASRRVTRAVGSRVSLDIPFEDVVAIRVRRLDVRTGQREFREVDARVQEVPATLGFVELETRADVPENISETLWTSTAEAYAKRMAEAVGLHAKELFAPDTTAEWVRP